MSARKAAATFVMAVSVYALLFFASSPLAYASGDIDTSADEKCNPFISQCPCGKVLVNGKCQLKGEKENMNGCSCESDVKPAGGICIAKSNCLGTWYTNQKGEKVPIEVPPDSAGQKPSTGGTVAPVSPPQVQALPPAGGGTPIADPSIFQYMPTPAIQDTGQNPFDKPDGTQKYLQELVERAQANPPVIEEPTAPQKSFLEQTLEHWRTPFSEPGQTSPWTPVDANGNPIGEPTNINTSAQTTGFDESGFSNPAGQKPWWDTFIEKVEDWWNGNGEEDDKIPEKAREAAWKGEARDATAYGVCFGMPQGCDKVQGAPTNFLDGSKIRTLECYSSGECSSVDVAGRASRLGQTGVIPKIQFKDTLTGEVKTLTNVPVTYRDKGDADIDFPHTIPPKYYENTVAINNILNNQPYNETGVQFIRTDGLVGAGPTLASVNPPSVVTGSFEPPALNYPAPLVTPDSPIFTQWFPSPSSAELFDPTRDLTVRPFGDELADVTGDLRMPPSAWDLIDITTDLRVPPTADELADITGDLRVPSSVAELADVTADLAVFSSEAELFDPTRDLTVRPFGDELADVTGDLRMPPSAWDLIDITTDLQVPPSADELADVTGDLRVPSSADELADPTADLAVLPDEPQDFAGNLQKYWREFQEGVQKEINEIDRIVDEWRAGVEPVALTNEVPEVPMEPEKPGASETGEAPVPVQERGAPLPSACSGPSVADCVEALGKNWSTERNKLAEQAGCTAGTANCNRQILESIRNTSGVQPPTQTPRPSAESPYAAAAKSYPTGGSIVNFLKAANAPSDFVSRANLAARYLGIPVASYRGSEPQNTALLQALRKTIR